METYNLGKIEILKDLTTPITEGFKISKTDSKNREYVSIRNEVSSIEEAVKIIENLGFRLPTVEESRYISDMFECIGERDLPAWSYWIDRGNGPEVVYFSSVANTSPIILNIDDYGNDSWSHTLFAVRDIKR
jgi:sporulation-control protein spo0M